MTRAHKVLGFLFVAVLGVYGCARGPAAGPGERTAQLEAKVQRLEDDFRAAAAARDSFRQRLTAAEGQLAGAKQQADAAQALAHQERQNLEAARAELKAAAADRDAAQGQYASFRKNVRELLGQAEAALAPVPAGPVVPVAVPTLTAAPAGNPAVNAADRN